MNSAEFTKFFEEHRKEAGTYTQAEMLELCKAHHSMSRKDRDWNQLAELIGFKKGGTALRKWTEYRLRKAADAVIETTEAQRELTDYEKEYIERTKTRDTWNSYRRTLRDEARIESFKNSLVNAIKDLPEIPVIDKDVRVDSDHKVEAILMLSDLHIGTQCDNSVNKYDNEIAWKRLCKLAADAVDYCITHNVYQLNIINLGDMVAGLIHDTIRLDQEADVVSQIMLASEYLAHLVNFLCQAAPAVTYRSCVDNHSRAVANKNQHIERENFNRIIDWFIEERLKDSKVKFIHDNLDLGLGRFKLLNNKVVMFAHGHEDKIDQSVQNFVGATHEWVDYVLMAHFHNSKEKTFQGAKVFVNGSIIGTDPYAYGKRLFGKPEQKLLIFDEDNVVDINIQLN